MVFLQIIESDSRHLGRAGVQVQVAVLWHGTLGSTTDLLGKSGPQGKPFPLVGGRFQVEDVHLSHGGEGGGRYFQEPVHCLSLFLNP